MADKKKTTKKKSGTGKKSVGRRSFLTTGAVAIGAAAVGGAACSTPGTPTSVGTAAVPAINAEKLQMFINDPALQKTWINGVKEVAHQLATDAEWRERFLSRTESVRLIKLYNDNANVIEPLMGHFDGRTLEGRMSKMVIAAEIFDNVAGFDFSYEGLEYQDDRCCSGLNGGCNVHYWGNYYGNYC